MENEMRRHYNSIARRSFLKGTLALAAAASVQQTFAAQKPEQHKPNTDSVSLREKFFGCIAGCHIGSAMGAAVEGWKENTAHLIDCCRTTTTEIVTIGYANPGLPKTAWSARS